jgi:hypothetical protein
MSGPDQRASDDDRQRVVRALERHTAAGRLTLDEYADRVDRALAARTHGQLAEVTGDLPAEPDPTAARSSDPAHTHAGTARQLGIAFLIALAALIVITGLVALKH